MDVAYDTTGDVTATVRLAATPTATNAFVVVYVGQSTGGACSPQLGLGTNVAPGTTTAVWTDGTDGDAATRMQDGATITVSASDYRLGGDNT